ncbi:hypothetical protein BDZ97DRAFT_1113408 [Flammula alnicola]|nr:hypothetical protein BDZ97DRAFT_1113408 [Flammula alnicola]
MNIHHSSRTRKARRFPHNLHSGPSLSDHLLSSLHLQQDQACCGVGHERLDDGCVFSLWLRVLDTSLNAVLILVCHQFIFRSHSFHGCLGVASLTSHPSRTAITCTWQRPRRVLSLPYGEFLFMCRAMSEDIVSLISTLSDVTSAPSFLRDSL